MITTRMTRSKPSQKKGVGWMRTPTASPTVYLPLEIKQQLDTYIKLSPLEISGLGEVEPCPGGVKVTRLHLFKQVCNSVGTVLSSEDIATFLCDAVSRGIDPSNLRLWWHSHVDMGVFWSSTDNETIQRFQADWMLSIVGNTHKKYRARLDLVKPLELTLDNLNIEVIFPENEELEKALQEEIDKKVTRAVVPQRKWYRDETGTWRLGAVGGPVYTGPGALLAGYSEECLYDDDIVDVIDLSPSDLLHLDPEDKCVKGKRGRGKN